MTAASLAADLAADLAAALGSVSRPGEFVVSGRVELLSPGLVVDGIGSVALPLLPVQAVALAALAEPAPYGKGEQTLYDPAVRRSGQIAAEQVRFGGRHWGATLAGIVERAAAGLGVDGPVAAELYKLLIYEPGGFFVSHRDTEKAPGMFATLVIVLPCAYEGGELVVSHRGRTETLDLKPSDPGEAGFAAFFADCLHEVRPISAGHRLTLIYNLIRPGRGKPLAPANYDNEQARATALLRAWAAGSDPDPQPRKLVYPLQHVYTPAELGFVGLKGADAGVAGVLTAAAAEAGCDLHLALLTIEEDGWAEVVDGGYGRHGRWSEPEFEVGEVDNRSETLGDWRRSDGTAASLGEIPVEDGEVSPPGALEDLPPDEESFHEATGNEGASFERSYRRAALVLWPARRFLAVLHQAGTPAALLALDDYASRWGRDGSGNRNHPLWQSAHELAGHIVGGWTAEPWNSWTRDENRPTQTGHFLETLTRLGDGQRIVELLEKETPRGGLNSGDTPAVLAALAVLEPATAALWLERLTDAAMARTPEAVAGLLARAAASGAVEHRIPLAGAAARLVALLPVSSQSPDRRAGLTSRLVVEVMTALPAIDATLAQRAAAHFLDHPKAYPQDSILIPALLKLGGGAAAAAALESLCHAACAHLRARIAEPLAPPADWRREAKLGCDCEDCQELARFLASPTASTWTLKAVQGRRSHVETTILNAKPDLTCTTLRKGSPHQLVCTKTQASYQRRVEQRQKDLADLQTLEPAATP